MDASPAQPVTQNEQADDQPSGTKDGEGNADPRDDHQAIITALPTPRDHGTNV